MVLCMKMALMRILTKVNGDSTDRERDKNHDDAGSIFYS